MDFKRKKGKKVTKKALYENGGRVKFRGASSTTKKRKAIILSKVKHKKKNGERTYM